MIPGVIRNILQGEVPACDRTAGSRATSLHRRCRRCAAALAQRLSEDSALYEEAFNFSYGEDIVGRDIVKRICLLPDTTVDPLMNDNGTAEIPKILLSSEKAKRYLSWKPSYDFTTALECAINWYREYFSQPVVHDYDWLRRTVITARRIQMARESDEGRILYQRPYD